MLVAVALPVARLNRIAQEVSPPSRLVERSQIVVPVTINHTGPYDFLVDTGAQVTTVDPAGCRLAAMTRGTAGVVGVGVYARAPLTELGTVEAGSHKVEKVLAVIQDLGQTALADRRVRGVLGGDFLEHFDLLIDYSRGILCLDDSAEMGKKVKGEHIPFMAQVGAQGARPLRKS